MNSNYNEEELSHHQYTNNNDRVFLFRQIDFSEKFKLDCKKIKTNKMLGVAMLEEKLG